jgi:hypothetical protein
MHKELSDQSKADYNSVRNIRKNENGLGKQVIIFSALGGSSGRRSGYSFDCGCLGLISVETLHLMATGGCQKEHRAKHFQ